MKKQFCAHSDFRLCNPSCTQREHVRALRPSCFFCNNLNHLENFKRNNYSYYECICLHFRELVFSLVNKTENKDKGSYKGNTERHSEPENLSACHLLWLHYFLWSMADQTWDILTICRTEPLHRARVPVASAKQEAPPGPWGGRALEAPAPGDGGGQGNTPLIGNQTHLSSLPTWEQGGPVNSCVVSGRCLNLYSHKDLIPFFQILVHGNLGHQFRLI